MIFHLRDSGRRWPDFALHRDVPVSRSAWKRRSGAPESNLPANPACPERRPVHPCTRGSSRKIQRRYRGAQQPRGTILNLPRCILGVASAGRARRIFRQRPERTYSARWSWRKIQRRYRGAQQPKIKKGACGGAFFVLTALIFFCVAAISSSCLVSILTVAGSALMTAASSDGYQLAGSKPQAFTSCQIIFIFIPALGT